MHALGPSPKKPLINHICVYTHRGYQYICSGSGFGLLYDKQRKKIKPSKTDSGSTANSDKSAFQTCAQKHTDNGSTANSDAFATEAHQIATNLHSKPAPKQKQCEWRATHEAANVSDVLCLNELSGQTLYCHKQGSNITQNYAT